jgi:hypothetical protein
MTTKKLAQAAKRKPKNNGKHPGGRPPKSEGEYKHQKSLRMNLAQWAKIKRNGGIAWLRCLVDGAKDGPLT